MGDVNRFFHRLAAICLSISVCVSCDGEAERQASKQAERSPQSTSMDHSQPVHLGATIDGVALDHGNNLAWPMDDFDANREELLAYFSRLKALNITAIRKLVGGNQGDTVAGRLALLKFVKIASEFGMKLYLYLGMHVPSRESIYVPEDNQAEYDRLLDLGKQRINRTVGFLAQYWADVDKTILGYSVGNGENLFAPANMDFVGAMLRYAKKLDPGHKYTTEFKSSARAKNGDLWGLPPSNPNDPEPGVARRSVYDWVDFVAIANYSDWYNPASLNLAQALLQIQRQNPKGLPVVVEEYGDRRENQNQRQFYLRKMRQAIANPPAGMTISSAFMWNAHSMWNTAARPLNDTVNWGLFYYDPSAPFDLGPTKESTLAVVPSRPEITGPMAGPKRLPVGVKANYSVLTVDLNGDQQRCEWDIDGDGGSDQISGVSATGNCWTQIAWQQGGSRRLGVRVVDIYQSASDWTFAMINAENAAPATPVRVAGLRTPAVGEPVAYSVQTTDPDGHQIRYGWDFNGDRVVDRWSTWVDSGRSTWTYQTWQRSTDAASVAVIVEDAFGGRSSWVVQPITVVSPNSTSAE